MPTNLKKKLVPGHIQNLKPYIPGKTIEDIREQYHPPRISKLGSNENRLGCSPMVLEAVKNGFESFANYPDPISRKLRKKLARKLNISDNRIILGNGSNGIIQYMVKAFFGEQEEALTASCTFVGFLVAAHINNIPLAQVDLTDDYRFDLEKMAGAINANTKMIYIANPNNPTGTYVSRNEFEAFMEQVPEDVLVVVDEAYYEFAKELDDYPHALDYDYPNLILLRTFSKAYGLAGLRVGYAVASERIITEMNKVKPTFSPSDPAQKAAFSALDDIEFIAKSVKVVERGRKRLYSLLDEFDIEYAESAANSVMMVFDSEAEAREFNQAMMERGVIIRPLPGFGMPNAIRVTIGDEPDMEHFEQSLRNILE